MSQESMQSIKELLAGSFGGIIQVLIGQPFDTVKVRLQTQSTINPTYTSVTDCVQKTIKQEGFKGFYKGTMTPLLGAGVCVAIQFSALEYTKRLFGYSDLSIGQLYLAGAVSGLANSIISGPMEHVRTRLQVQTGLNQQYSGPWDFIKQVTKLYGISGLYKGQAITLLREFHGYGIYFMVYEYMIQSEMLRKRISRKEISTFKQLSFGALSGYTLWIMIYPITDAFDRKAAKYSSSIDCCKKTFIAEGYRGFYKGFVPCMMRAGPSNAATFAAYEVAMNAFGR